MKDMINYLFAQIGDEYTHTLKNVTTESLNCHNIFKTFVDDGNKLDEKEKLIFFFFFFLFFYNTI